MDIMFEEALKDPFVTSLDTYATQLKLGRGGNLCSKAQNQMTAI